MLFCENRLDKILFDFLKPNNLNQTVYMYFNTTYLFYFIIIDFNFFNTN